MIENLKGIKEKFKDPGKEYRPVPFWSWNDRLSPELLRWQIGEMDKTKLGGYFMHARAGLETEYLSDEWMECVRTCIDEGKKRGMKSWVYDEVGWPSGFAGGLVTALGDEYHARGLKMEELDQIDEFPQDENILGVYLWNRHSNQITYLHSNDEAKSIDANSKILVVKHVSGPYYIDVMNEKTVKVFIQITHEKYYNEFKEEFGTGFQGFFTDEPRFSVENIPWSYIFAPKFNEKYGYDIIKRLPALFIPCEGYEKVRYDFWSLANELFVSSFMKQLYTWCEDHGCKLTGHVMMEESLYSQMTGTAGVMPFYEYMQIPGVDWLRRMIYNPIVPKQVGSVASQLGKKQVLTESYALSGWNVSFEELKWIADWQYVNGVNLMCQHLEGYTLRGMRKRDYPPSLFFQQPWWEEYGVLNDYLARLGVVLSSGKPMVDVLMLHPMRSAFIAYDGTNNERLQKLDRDFIKASEMLSDIHVDYHYGDETILEKHAKIVGSKFIVGQCAYRMVVLPSMISLSESTLILLEEFIDNGGHVISLGEFPKLCNGQRDSRVDRLEKQVQCIGENREALYTYLEEHSVRDISISQNNREIGEIHYHARQLGDTYIFFMVNHSQTDSFSAKIRVKEEGRVKRLNPDNGEIESVLYRCQNGMTEIDLEFLPMQSHVLAFERGKNAERDYGSTKDFSSSCGSLSDTIIVEPNREWHIDYMDHNAITLDYCCYQIDNGEWLGPVPVIKLMDILLGLKRSCDIALKFDFKVDMDPDDIEQIYLILELPEENEIYVNGIWVEYQNIGWWKDTAFKKIDIKPFVKKGQNQVLLKRRFFQSSKVYDVLFGENVYESEFNKLTYNVELESIYIIGDFGVVSKSPYTTGERKAIFTEGPFALVHKPEKVYMGDLTQQGFCFFAGKIMMSQLFNVNKKSNSRIVLHLKRPNAVVSKVFINDQLVKTLPWAPYTVDITDAVRDGENKLSIQLFSGNRNLLGPHHHIDGESYSVGPLSFKGEYSFAERKTEALPTTEEERTRNYWREGYCFVEFGLEE